MLFNSAPFLFAFLPLTVAGYFLALRYMGKLPSQLWLFIASLFYYGWWSPFYVILILGSLLCNFYLGKYLQMKPDRKALLFGIGANLAVLGYYKYTGFFLSTLNQAAGTDFFIPAIILPVGISFFTFQNIAFLADCHRRIAQPGQSLINFGLFITFFPQLIAGPIVHHKEMMPQFARPRGFDPFNFSVGLCLLAIGLFKKVLLADTLDEYASPLFDAARHRPLHIVEAWVAALAYTFQIYFDFSAYSDMALGLGKMFNIRLPVNFFSPYKALNIIDFWRRWHMTLSRFLRDYLYIPLGGNRKGKARRYVNLMMTMLLGGLWHGANWTFVIWGGLHGIYLAVNHWWQERGFFALPAWAARTATFFAVVLAWIFFRAADFSTATSMLSSMFDLTGFREHSVYAAMFGKQSPLRATFGPHDAVFSWVILLASFIICWTMPNSIEIMRKGRPCIGGVRRIALSRHFIGRALTWRPALSWGIAAGCVLSISIAKVLYEPSQVFLYFQF